jgi:hypothetical protein
MLPCPCRCHLEQNVEQHFVFYKAHLQIKIKMRCLFLINLMSFHVETIREPEDNHGVCLNLAGVHLRIFNFALCNHFRIQGFGYPCLRSCCGVVSSSQRSQASCHIEKTPLLAGALGKVTKSLLSSFSQH